MEIKLRARSKIAPQIQSKVAMVPFGRAGRETILNGYKMRRNPLR